SHADRVILFGGFLGYWFNDTWAYDFNTNTWTNMAPAVSPPADIPCGMAYDAQSDRMILIVGCSGTSSTWAYDFSSNMWTNMNPVARPSLRSEPAMTYDAQADRVILFGGRDQSGGFYPNDTWAYDFEANTWTNMAPVVSPPGRSSPAVAYDSASSRVILFSGWNYGTPNDTWAYDSNVNNWTRMDPPATPSPRSYHAMAYDSQSDRVILFSGYGLNGKYFDDTWAYDFNANKWTNKDPFPKPPMRYCHATAYDAQSDRVILFGGDLAGGLFNDTWAYDFNTNAWTNLDPPAKPPVRYEHAMAYDSGSDRLIMFGGAGSSGYLNDTWAYDFNKNTWTNASASPSARYSHAMVYDSQTDRAILFGGYSVAPGSGYLNDTWAYDFNT